MKVKVSDLTPKQLDDAFIDLLKRLGYPGLERLYDKPVIAFTFLLAEEGKVWSLEGQRYDESFPASYVATGYKTLFSVPTVARSSSPVGAIIRCMLIMHIGEEIELSSRTD